MSTGDAAAALARIEVSQRRSHERLRADASARALLVQLLESSCLAELEKLQKGRLDAALYLQVAVDVVTQMYPVRGVAATVAKGVPKPIEVRSGEPMRDGTQYPLMVGEELVGFFVAGSVRVDFGSSEAFMRRVAGQLALGLATVLDDERRRRDTAVAAGARLASQLRPETLVEGLESVARALASFPSVVGVELQVDHLELGPPLHLKAGSWIDDDGAHGISSVSVEIGADARVVARLRAANGEPPAVDGAAEVLDHLATALAGIVAARRVHDAAEIDSLTGLGNRRRLARVLPEALTRAHRCDEYVGVLMIDVWPSSPVESSIAEIGRHEAVLAAAHALRERTRDQDECVRLRGGQFVVLAPVRRPGEATRLAEQIRDAVIDCCNERLPGHCRAGTAVGVSWFPNTGRDPATLLRFAEEALGRAKAPGGEGIAVASVRGAVREQGTPDTGAEARPRRRRFLKRGP